MHRSRSRVTWIGTLCRVMLGAVVSWGTIGRIAAAQEPRDQLPIQRARTISFETSEGTMMNVDLSPDGRTLIFDLLGDIYTVPVSGGSATQLTRGLAVDTRPVWSPDGRRIAYVSDAGGVNSLWIMGADGADPRPVAIGRPRVTDEGQLAFVEVEWTPDGRSLLSNDTLFHLMRGKQPLRPAGLPAARRGVPMRFSPDGRYVYFSFDGVRRYDRTTGETLQVAQPPVPVMEPVVSPDGRWLAYVTLLRSPEAKGLTPYNGLRIRDLETGEDRWLAYPTDKYRIDAERYVFTPDSKSIIVGYGGKLHRIDVATGEDSLIPFTAKVTVDLGPFIYHRFRVTNDSLMVRYVRSPAVSPDGRTLVFSALQRLYTMALPHGTPKPLIRQAGGQFHPAYSPDGQWIAYVTWSDVEGGHVWRIPAAGGTPERLTSVAGYYQRPAWSPDGATLAVLTAGTKDAHPRDARSGWLQLLPSAGGTPRTVLQGVSRVTPATFTPDGHRLFVQDASGPGEGGGTGPLVSVRPDGSDRRVIARIADGSPWAWPIMPSPDGRYIAFMVHEDLYLAPLHGALDSVMLGDSTDAVPVVRLMHGALDLRWDHDGRTLIWAVANQVFRLDADRAMAAAAPDTASAPRLAPDAVIPVRLTAPRHTAHGTVALRGARVITMRGAEVLESATVVITDDRIAAVGPASSVAIPKSARVFDLRGKTIVPGFVDLHAHYTWQEDETFQQRDWRYLASLAYGVTTARDVARNAAQFGDAELIEAGRMLGPRLFSVGWAFIPGTVQIASLDDARAAVQHRKAMGAIVVKQYGQPTRRQRQWVLQAATEAGINVTNEAGNVRQDLELIFDGATGVEHGIRETSLYGDVTRLMAVAKTWYTPTMQVGYGGDARPYFRARYHWLYESPKYRRFVPYETVLETRRSGVLQRPGDSGYMSFLDAARSAAEIVHQGGHVTLGSHGEDQGLGVHWELWALQMGGLTNHEALRVATLRGAEGLGVQDDLGSIEVGKIADLLVLDQNPLENIEHTLSIRYVMKNGILYDDGTLSTLWPEKRALPAWMYVQDDLHLE